MSLEERLGEERLSGLDAAARNNMQRLIESTAWDTSLVEALYGKTNVIAGGVDICYIPELEEVIADTPSLVRRIFSPTEIAYCQIQSRPGQHFAVRYAAKEAGFKACGYSYRDFTVIHLPTGHPDVVLEGRAIERAVLLNAGEYHLGLSHTHDYAIAQLIVLERVLDSTQASDVIDIPG